MKKKVVKLNQANLRKLLETKDITFLALASLLHTSTKTISRWISGKVNHVPLQSVEKMAKFLDTETDYLIQSENIFQFVSDISKTKEENLKLLTNDDFFYWFEKNGNWNQFLTLAQGLLVNNDIPPEFQQNFFYKIAKCYYFLSTDAKMTTFYIEKSLNAEIRVAKDFFRVNLLRANFDVRVGDYHSARARLDQLSLLNDDFSEAEIARINCSLTELELVVGDFHRVNTEGLEKAIEIFNKSEDKKNLLGAIYFLAMTYQFQLLDEKSYQVYQELLQMARRFKNSFFEHEALIEIAILDFENGRIEEAQNNYKAALRVYKDYKINPNYYRIKSYLEMVKSTPRSARVTLAAAKKFFKNNSMVQFHIRCWQADLLFLSSENKKYKKEVTTLRQNFFKIGLSGMANHLVDKAQKRRVSI